MVLSKAITTISRTQVRNFGSFSKADTKSFKWAGMKKNPAVLPLVFIISGAVTGLCAFIAYCSATRVDVGFNRSNPQLCDSMDVMKPSINKIRVLNQKYEPMPELAAALEVVRKN